MSRDGSGGHADVNAARLLPSGDPVSGPTRDAGLAAAISVAVVRKVELNALELSSAAEPPRLRA